MPPRTSSGTCHLCKKSFKRTAISAHTIACLRTSGLPASDKPSYLIQIEGTDSKEFWMLVLARHDAKLFDLDLLIRDVWVECCDHLSEFTIAGQNFASEDNYHKSGLSVPLNHLIRPGSTFTYRYDFGSTTELTLHVICQSPVATRTRPLVLIARNDRPEMPCRVCGKAAEYLTSFWHDDPDPTLLCRDCTRKNVDDLDDECMSVIPNSPRCGVCGYVEDPKTALRWYPEGRSLEGFYPTKSEDMLTAILYGEDDEDEDGAEESLPVPVVRVSHTSVCTAADLRREISKFVDAEMDAHGIEHGAHVEFIVGEFCANMCGVYKKNVSAWDSRTVKMCLLKEMALSRDMICDGVREVVPILTRFLAHLEKTGYLAGASELSKTLNDAEPAFEEPPVKNEKELDLFIDVLTTMMSRKVSALHGTGINPFDASVATTITGNELPIRKTMVRIRCDEFCERFSDKKVSTGCANIVEELAQHPAAPLLHGDTMLWSAGIVYVVCQRENLIGRGTRGSQFGNEIAEFFAVNASSMKSKASTLKKFLPAPDSPQK